MPGILWISGYRVTLRDLVDGEGLYFGSICTLPGSIAAEVMGRAGFDWLFLDLEHAPTDRASVVQMLQSLELTGVPSFVRPPWNRPEMIGWVLDMGAHGVMVPMIGSAEDTDEAVRSCRYAPRGHRSWGALRPMQANRNYSPAVGDAAVVCGVMIETVQAVDAIEEIAAVDGLDVVGVGQSDLAISFGLHPLEGRRHPDHLQRLQRIADVARQHGRTAWIQIGSDLSFARQVAEMGYRLISVETDAGLLVRGAAAALENVRPTADD